MDTGQGHCCTHTPCFLKNWRSWRYFSIAWPGYRQSRLMLRDTHPQHANGLSPAHTPWRTWSSVNISPALLPPFPLLCSAGIQATLSSEDEGCKNQRRILFLSFPLCLLHASAHLNLDCCCNIPIPPSHLSSLVFCSLSLSKICSLQDCSTPANTPPPRTRTHSEHTLLLGALKEIETEGWCK